MKTHYFQHVPFEGLGSIENWLLDHDHSITCTHLYEAHTLPKPDDIDFLIIMGGPMSVNDEAQYPWLQKEKAFIRDFIDTGKPVLGICLGAQLIASALGAEVFANPEKEIGWFPIQADTTPADILCFPDGVQVFHWHGETFDLPPGAFRFAESAACRNQGFQLGNNVIGLQFHLETTPMAAHALVEHCRHELEEDGPFIQSESEILETDPRHYRVINSLMKEVLCFLARSGRH